MLPQFGVGASCVNRSSGGVRGSGDRHYPSLEAREGLEDLPEDSLRAGVLCRWQTVDRRRTLWRSPRHCGNAKALVEFCCVRVLPPCCFRHQLLAPRSSTVPAIVSAARFLITSSTRTIARSEDAMLLQRQLHQHWIEEAPLTDRAIGHPLAA